MMRMTALTEGETLEMLRAAHGHSARAHAMVLLAIRHGLRASEVTALPLDHVNLKERWVRIERLKGSKVTVQPLERHPGQPLLDEVRVLGRYLRERRDDGSGILFTSSHGGAMHRSTFFRIWRDCATRAGLPPEKRHPHCAKHTLGSLLGRAGASAFHIQRALGHSSITSSSHYVGLTDQDVAGTVRRAWMGAF